MKKTVSILLCIILLAGLASCGKQEVKTPEILKTDSSSEILAESSSVNTAESSSADYAENPTGNQSENPTGSQSGNPTENSHSVTSENKPVSKVKVTIPEGYTLLRISWLLEDKGLCTSDEFVKAAQTANQWLDLNEYPFLKGTFNAKNVCFYLEGYIFPLTYEIPEGTDVKTIIKMLLNGTRTRFNSDFLARVSNSGYTLHEILTIASIVEKEANSDDQRPMISSVLYNRLKAKMPFQCDVCIKYCEGVIKIAYPDKFPTIKEYYNGKNVGMLAGPICNPGMKSINAALNPANTDYLYFIIGTVPPYEAHYSKTYEEHNAYWQANKDRLTGK